MTPFCRSKAIQQQNLTKVKKSEPSSKKTPRRISTCALVALCLSFSVTALAWQDKGSWSISGEVVDLRMISPGRHYTNTLSITGHYDGGRFLLEVTPIKTSDEVAESVAWDGERMRLILRYPEMPGEGQPRDQSFAYVEASIFARFAMHPTLAAMVALADTNSLKYLESGQEPIILGGDRMNPEEENTYQLKFAADGSTSIAAHTPGRRVKDSGEEEPIPGVQDGFTKWEFEAGAPVQHDDPTRRITLPFEYRRYYPSNAKLVQFRTVTGSLILQPAERMISDFKPKITEPRLRVLDLSTRREFFSFTKGKADHGYGYELTNRLWDHDEKLIGEWALEIKAGWIAKGFVPNNVVERRIYVPHFKEKRRTAFWILMAFFFTVPVALWQFNRRQKNKNVEIAKT